jgi:hypothetical protein
VVQRHYYHLSLQIESIGSLLPSFPFFLQASESFDHLESPRSPFSFEEEEKLYRGVWWFCFWAVAVVGIVVDL